MPRRILPLLLAAIALSACVTTHAIELGTPGRYPPVDPLQVQVFLAEADVKLPFEKIAVIEAKGDYSMIQDEDMVKAMKKKAAKLGANALILGEFKDPSAVEKVAHALLNVSAERKGRVLAIRIEK